jgi:hypothetical protein
MIQETLVSGTSQVDDFVACQKQETGNLSLSQYGGEP